MRKKKLGTFNAKEKVFIKTAKKTSRSEGDNELPGFDESTMIVNIGMTLIL